jgi:hypothetical protein
LTLSAGNAVCRLYDAGHHAIPDKYIKNRHSSGQRADDRAQELDTGYRDALDYRFTFLIID